MNRLVRLGVVVLLALASLAVAPVPAAGVQSCGGLPVTIMGSDDDDVIRGTRHRDVIDGRGGADVIRGLGGRDWICGGSGRDRVVGGTGGDELNGGQGRDRLAGGRGRDVLHGGAGRDALDGQAGSDGADFGGGGPVDVDLRVDRAHTGDGAERLTRVENVTGSGGADVIRGDAERNGLGGGGGKDAVYGLGGSDITAVSDGGRAFGGSGRDLMYTDGNGRAWGGAGGDYLAMSGTQGRSRLDGGAGRDVFAFSFLLMLEDRPTRIDLAEQKATVAAARVRLSNIEDARGGSGDDLILGSSGRNRLWGGGGNDLIRGRGGDDRLEGEGWFDTLNGGGGHDRCYDYADEARVTRGCEEIRISPQR